MARWLAALLRNEIMPPNDADRLTVDIQIDETFAPLVDAEAIVAAVRHTLDTVGIDGAVEVSIVLTTDEVVRELNRVYRGQDKATDVLSFGQDDGGPLLPPDLPRLLGDVVIAYPQVAAQAGRAGWDAQDELVWLVIHGVLHLLGYDDADEAGRAAMWAMGEQILGRRAPGGPTDG